MLVGGRDVEIYVSLEQWLALPAKPAVFWQKKIKARERPPAWNSSGSRSTATAASTSDDGCLKFGFGNSIRDGISPKSDRIPPMWKAGAGFWLESAPGSCPFAPNTGVMREPHGLVHHGHAGAKKRTSANVNMIA